MKSIILAAAFSLVASSAFAASCKVEAGTKKLAGAAMTSFMTKCETDAKATCEKDSTAKKIVRRGQGRPYEEMRERRRRQPDLMLTEMRAAGEGPPLSFVSSRIAR